MQSWFAKVGMGIRHAVNFLELESFGLPFSRTPEGTLSLEIREARGIDPNTDHIGTSITRHLRPWTIACRVSPRRPLFSQALT